MVEPRDGSTIPDPRDRNLSARDRMIAAGLDALARRGTEILADGLHRKRLAAISGQSRQTLYTHFSTHTGYLDAMIDVILDPEHPMWPVRDITEYVDDIFDSSTDGTLSVIEELARRDFDGLLENEHWRLVLAVRALLGDDPGIRDGLTRNWTYYHARTTAALGRLLEQWNVELAPPWTVERAAHVFAALSEGLALRVDALAGEGADLLAMTTATLAAAIVTPVGELARPLETVIPVEIDRAAGVLTPAHVELALAHALTSYVEADRRPSFEALAAASGCSSAALRTQFAGVDDVVSAIWDRFALDISRQGGTAPADQPPLDRLRAHLETLATLTRTSVALTTDLLGLCLSRGGTDPALEALIDPFESLLRQARQAGELSFDPAPRVLADHLVRTTLRVCVAGTTPRVRTPRPEVDLVWCLVIEGCRTTSHR